ncbi:MAG: flagellar motor switch protein FliN [Pseudomonadota bacterium]
MTDFSPALHRFGDVAVRLSVELGRTDMPLRDVLALGQGSVITLNRLTDELLDITANGKVIAQGEVIAQDGKFALRIVALVGEEHSAPNMTMPAASAGTIHSANSSAAMPPSAPAGPAAASSAAPAEPLAPGEQAGAVSGAGADNPPHADAERDPCDLAASAEQAAPAEPGALSPDPVAGDDGTTEEPA